MITKDVKISNMLSDFPQTLRVLIKLSPHFTRLNNNILRKTLASRVNVEQAAGIAGVNLTFMLYELNKVIGEYPETQKNNKGQVDEMNESNNQNNGEPKIDTDKFLQLDVRPIIDSGKDPFLEIMAKVKTLQNDEGLHLINSFEPFPLYSIMQNKGFKHRVNNEGNIVNVYFYKDAKQQYNLVKDVEVQQSGFADIEKVIELDVRELVPPEPMMKILENINRVDEKTILLVHHHREPLMLYPKLEERGYEAVTNKISENYYKVVIKKKERR